MGTRGGGGGWWGLSLEDEGPPSNPEDHGAWGGGALTDRFMGLERTAEGAPACLRAAAWGVPVLTEWGGARADCLDGCTGPTKRKTTWGWPVTLNRREAKSPNRRDNTSWRASGYDTNSRIGSPWDRQSACLEGDSSKMILSVPWYRREPRPNEGHQSHWSRDRAKFHQRPLAMSCPQCLGPKYPDSETNAGNQPPKQHSAGREES